MKKYNIELHDSNITQKGVAAITDFYRTMAVAELKIEGVNAFVTGVKDSAFLNVVIDTRKNEKNNLDVKKLVTSFFDDHQVQWAWFVEPTAKIGDLEKMGLSLLEEAPGMYFDLSHSLPELESSDITIKEVGENDDLVEWTECLNEGFPNDDKCEAYRQLNVNLLHRGEKKLRHFVAYYKNELASCATLFLSGDCIMLHNLATKKAFRKLGLGKALGIYRMMLAKQLGFKHCFMDASEEGFEVYTRLGFQIYCLTKAYGI